MNRYLRKIPLLLLLIVLPINAAQGAEPRKPSLPLHCLDEARIVGGESADYRCWPWIVSVVERNRKSTYNGHFCGGALIRPRIVLTAAHCAEEVNRNNTDIVWRRTNLKSTKGKRVAVVARALHPS